jgi:glutathione peroxidase
MPSIYDFEAESIDGKTVSLGNFRNKVLLVVNTASFCGLTPQFAGLEEIYKEFHSDGLEILGFPCNQFREQDPHSNTEIQGFCQKNYGVTFPMFSKIEVNGENTHPLYQFLKKEAPGILGTKKIKWNFTKFLIGRDGKVLQRFSPMAKPETLIEPIKKALAN